MSKWEKEDRSIYENSEVMMEFEKLILSRCVQLKDIYKKAQETKIEKATEDAKELNQALKDVETTAKNVFSADDGEVEEESSEDITISAKEEVISELEKLANDALESKNMPLLYKIERTISEIMENE
jgi:predicted nucleotidyltransferase